MKNIYLLVFSLFLLAACEKTFLQGSNLSSESNVSTLNDCESIKKIGSTFVVEDDHLFMKGGSSSGPAAAPVYSDAIPIGSGQIFSQFRFIDNSFNNGYCFGSSADPIGCVPYGSQFNGALEVYPSQAKANLCYLRFNSDPSISGSGISTIYSFRSLGSGQFDFFDYMLIGSELNALAFGSYPFDSFPEIDEYLNQNLHVIGPGYYR